MLVRLAPVALLLALTLSAAGCGGGDESSQTTAPATTATTSTESTTTGQSQLDLTVYFLRNGRVSPVRVRLPRTEAVANAALDALLDGPPAGYDTAIPDGTDADVTTVDRGTAEIDIIDPLDGAGNAQLAYTLTSIPGVTGIQYDGLVNPDTGAQTDRPLTRADFERFVPPILVESPLPHDEVAPAVRVRGTASVFEATLVVELRQAGKLVDKQTVTASEGAPGRGTFTATLRGVASGPAALVAYSPSAEDGSQQHRVDVPVEVRP